MFKFTLLAIFLVTVSVSANLDKFVGTWTPVAMYPKIGRDAQECPRASLAASNNKCTCANGNVAEVLDVKPEKLTRPEDEKITLPVIVVDKIDDVAAALNSPCTCDGELEPRNTVVRSISQNYFVIYRNFGAPGNETVATLLVAQEIPTETKLREDLKDLDEFPEDVTVCCTSEIANIPVEPTKQHMGYFIFP